jgi:hypothetical protein
MFVSEENFVFQYYVSRGVSAAGFENVVSSKIVLWGPGYFFFIWACK